MGDHADTRRRRQGPGKRWLLVRVLVALTIVLAFTPTMGTSWAAAQDIGTPPSDAASSADAAVATDVPTEVPTETPTEVPTETPTEVPAETPTDVPTETPTAAPTDVATAAPTDAPSETPTPTDTPTNTPKAVSVSGTPFIVSDQADYHPGELITLTGGNWQPGEIVHIFVNDDEGQSWSRNVDVTADDNGNITDSFNLPNRFVANYSVKATGSVSGLVTTTFTDTNLKSATIETRNSACTTVQTSFVSGFTVCARAIIQNSGTSTSDWRLKWFAPGVNTTSGSPTFDDLYTGTVDGATVDTLHQPSTIGVWTVVVCDGTRAGGCSASIKSTTFTVTAPAATTTTLSRSPNASTTYGTSITFTATVTSTPTNPSGVGTVTFMDGATAICSNIALTGTTAPCTVTTLTAATHSITAVYNGGPGFATSTSTALSHSVNPKSITGAFTASDKVYDGATAATILTRTLAGVVGADDVSLTGGAATFVNKSVGTAKVVTGTGFGLSGTTAGNYALSSTSLATSANITVKGLTISGAVANGKTYDGTTAATVSFGSATLTGVISPDVVSINSASSVATFADKNVGAGRAVAVTGVSLTGADSGNYTVSQPAGLTAGVAAKPITGSFTTASKVYDGTVAATAITRSLSGAIAGDAVSLTGGTAAFVNKNVGTGKIVALTGTTLTGADIGNYTLTSVNTATADITPAALTVSAIGVNKTYDGATAATVTLSDNRVSGDVFTSSATNATFADRNVGNGKAVSVSGISISGTDSGNYTFNTTAATTATITARAITVTADAKTKSFGASDPPLTYQVASGALAGGDVLTGALTRVAGEAVGPHAIQQGTLAAGANYALTYNGANLTIASTSVTLTATNAAVRVAEGQAASNTGTYSNPGVPVTLSASLGIITDNHDGTWSWSFATTDGPAQSQTVTITAAYSGGPATTTFSLVVSNVAPTATFSAPATVNEGSSITLSLTAPADPSSVDATAGFTYAFDCGSGYGSFSSTNTASCATNDNGSRTVKGQIKDKDGGFTEYTATVTVHNVTPVVTAAPNQAATAGTGQSFNLGSFTDPGADNPWTVTVVWGDAGPTTTISNVATIGTIAAQSHSYAIGASYTVKVTVTDKDGGASNEASFTVTVAPTISLTLSTTSVNFGGINPSGADFQMANAVTVTVASSNAGWSGTSAISSNTGTSGIPGTAVSWKINGSAAAFTPFSTSAPADCFTTSAAGTTAFAYDYQLHVNWTDNPGSFQTTVTYSVQAAP